MNMSTQTVALVLALACTAGCAASMLMIWGPRPRFTAGTWVEALLLGVGWLGVAVAMCFAYMHAYVRLHQQGRL